jgi:hypothetical protein
MGLPSSARRNSGMRGVPSLIRRTQTIALTPSIETYSSTAMTQYKRNQVEEAISRSVGEKSAKPFLTRLKRLLDADRALTISAREKRFDVINYAFYRSDSPGSGADVWFSEYEAFALQTSLRLLHHGWPQSFAVNALRHIRSDLEREHARILKQDPGKLFDKEAIKKKARAGDLAVDNTDPVYLTIVSGKAVFSDGIADQTSVGVCRGMDQVSEFIQQRNAQSWTLIELVTWAHDFRKQLNAVQPRTRGRS